MFPPPPFNPTKLLYSHPEFCSNLKLPHSTAEAAKRSFPPEYYYIILTKNEIHALHHQTLTPILLKYRKRQVTHTTHVLSSTKHLSCISQHVSLSNRLCQILNVFSQHPTCATETRKMSPVPKKSFFNTEHV